MDGSCTSRALEICSGSWAAARRHWCERSTSGPSSAKPGSQGITEAAGQEMVAGAVRGHEASGFYSRCFSARPPWVFAIRQGACKAKRLQMGHWANRAPISHCVSSLQLEELLPGAHSGQDSFHSNRGKISPRFPWKPEAPN